MGSALQQVQTVLQHVLDIVEDDEKNREAACGKLEAEFRNVPPIAATMAVVDLRRLSAVAKQTTKREKALYTFEKVVKTGISAAV